MSGLASAWPAICDKGVNLITTMNTFVLYLAAVALCGVSTVLIRNASAYTGVPNVGTEVRTRFLFVGRLFIAIAAVSAGLGAVAQYSALLHH